MRRSLTAFGVSLLCFVAAITLTAPFGRTESLAADLLAYTSAICFIACYLLAGKTAFLDKPPAGRWKSIIWFSTLTLFVIYAVAVSNLLE